MPIELADQESILRDSNAQESDDNFFQVGEIDEDLEIEFVIASIDSIVVADHSPTLTPPIAEPPVPCDDYLEKHRAYCTALEAERFADEQAEHFVEAHDDTAEGQVRQELKVWADELLADLNDLCLNDEPTTETPIGEFIGPRLYLKWKWLYEQHRLSRDPRSIRQENLFKAAQQGIAKAKAADSRRKRNTERRRQARQSATVVKAKRLTALLKATAAPHGDKRFEQLRGREMSLVMFRDAMEIKPSASLTGLKDIYCALTGDRMTKSQAQNRREIIMKLEAPGGIWCRWKSRAG